VQRHGAIHGDKILDTVAEKYPANYFASMVALSRIMRWETGLPTKRPSRRRLRQRRIRGEPTGPVDALGSMVV
jgi:hypothetical protein